MRWIMYIETETTPNPAVLKFLPGREVMPAGTREFAHEEDAAASPLAEALFKNGASSYLEVLDAQRALYTAQQDAIALRLPAPLAVYVDGGVEGAGEPLQEQAGDEAVEVALMRQDDLWFRKR